jgi:long-chain acyl-CoA synthetase
MYPTITEQDYNFIFKDADVKIVFVSTEELYHKVKRALHDVPGILAIYTFDHVPEATHWSTLLEKGKGKSKELLRALQEQVSPEDLLTLIYTSGTTGNPKGVMLTHANLVSNFTDSAPIVPVDHTAKALSFLPLCHIFERMVTYLYFRCGVSIYYAESMETIADNLKEVKPEIFTTVPRLLEKVYDKIVAKGNDLKGVKKSLFFWALELGLQYDPRQNKGWWYNTQLALANKLIFSKWRAALGGNVVAIVSGGAALQPRLARVFWSAKIMVMEGYGLTETSPVISVNLPDPQHCYIGTTGMPIKNVEVRIAEDGEILCKGPNVMKGYYKRPDLTAEVLTSDGWFHTGDIGELVEGKYLKITDRKKEMFKTSGGKYVAPQLIENKLKESIFIEQVMVVGNGRKFPSALIVPTFQTLRDYATLKGIAYTTDDEMIRNPQIVDKIQREVEKYNEAFAQWEQIKKVAILPALWTVDAGELTAKLSLRRKVIEQKYEKEIEKLYS